MKRLLLLLFTFCILFSFSYSQSVGVGTTSPNNTAQLDVNSNSKGFLMPRMTNEQRLVIANPAIGLMVYQINGTRGIYHYNGKQWLNLTYGLKADEEGHLYGTVSTYAGYNSLTTDVDGPIDVATFNDPKGLAADAAGNLFMAEPNSNIIRKISTDGIVSTVAGINNGQPGSVDGSVTVATFSQPWAVAVDKMNSIYIVDRDNQKIRKISNGIVSTVAGTGFQGDTDGPGNTATFFYPYAIAADTSMNLFIADSYNNKIRKITPDGVVSTFAGTGAADFNDGPGSAAAFNQPQGIATDSFGNVFVADSYNNRIRKITPDGLVSTLAGSGTGSSLDGQGIAAQFYHPAGITVDAFGHIYVTEESTRKIRKISPAGNVTTVAGKYVVGTCASVNGNISVANFCNPWGIVVSPPGSSDGIFFVTDYNTIRKVEPIE